MSATPSNGLLWAGRVLSALAVLFFLYDGGLQVLGKFIAPDVLRQMMEEGGLPVTLAPILGSAILISTLLYAIPRTTVLGAILITGYLGGAISIDLRAHGIAAPGQIISAILGLFVWGGLYLRNAKVRAILPFCE